ncbi:hypothetical protein C8J57DRAFT_1231924 [Mycena rebaudengoi]|nr:hypothetical protein C8J57DRAFT_1231924 [Mycena rebaudengoi]
MSVPVIGSSTEILQTPPSGRGNAPGSPESQAADCFQGACRQQSRGNFLHHINGLKLRRIGASTTQWASAASGSTTQWATVASAWFCTQQSGSGAENPSHRGRRRNQSLKSSDSAAEIK